MFWSLFEAQVPLPHVVVIDRLPAEVTAGGVTVTLTGEVGTAGVVGTLRCHVAGARWQAGRRHGIARYEVVRTHPDRCAVTVLLEGLPPVSARELVDEVRRSVVAVGRVLQPA